MKLFWVKHFRFLKPGINDFKCLFFIFEAYHYFQSFCRRRRGEDHIFVFNRVFNTGIGQFRFHQLNLLLYLTFKYWNFAFVGLITRVSLGVKANNELVIHRTEINK